MASDAELALILQQIDQGLDEGGLGIGPLVGYAPQSGRKEFYAVHALPASGGAQTFTHARFLSSIEPQISFEGFQEIVSVAAATGAHMHFCHVKSMSMTDVDVDAIADMIASAQARGVKLTVEAYPYGAGATGMDADIAVLDPNRVSDRASYEWPTQASIGF